MSGAHHHGTVFILGAGFSKPLGGPLLVDFMSEGLERRLIEKYPGVSVDHIMRVRLAYLGWSHLSPSAREAGRVSARCPWWNPEQFVAMLGQAANEPDRSAIRRVVAHVTNAPESEIAELFTHAVQYLAMATDYFLPDPAIFASMEAAKAYRTWASQLSAGDTVVSFNYDRVVEVARGTAGLAVASPSDPESAARCDSPRLLKLHGSVTFTSGATARSKAARARSFGVDGSESVVASTIGRGGEFLIGVPGPSKLHVAERMEHAWCAAEDALRSASTVVFIGYRFAETDDEAKRRLLGALRQNRHQKLTVRIVLGLPNDDGRRVLEMVRWALRGRRLWAPNDEPPGFRPSNVNEIDCRPVVDLMPFYAQDFLTLTDSTSWNHWMATAP